VTSPHARPIRRSRRGWAFGILGRMRHLGWAAAISVCGLACNFDASGGTSSAGQGSGTEEGSTSEPSETSSSPEVTSAGDSSPDDDTSTSTSSASTTTDPTTDPTADTSSTGSKDDTTSTTSDDEDSTGAETTGLDHDWYTACRCQDGLESCVNFYNQNQDVIANICYAIPCNGSDDCPMPPSGNAMPVCVTLASLPNGGCGLDCTADSSGCPTGMTCYALQGGFSRCAWSVD
jgi:hypothetical protein